MNPNCKGSGWTDLRLMTPYCDKVLPCFGGHVPYLSTGTLPLAHFACSMKRVYSSYVHGQTYLGCAYRVLLTPSPESDVCHTCQVTDAAIRPVKATGPQAPEVSPIPADTVQSPRATRMAEMSGAAPSAEIRILQQARESAKAAAEASGSGRRARVPSIKALQAAGLVEVEGAQWMSREKQREQKLRLREYKEAVREHNEYKKRMKVELAARVASGQAAEAPLDKRRSSYDGVVDRSSAALDSDKTPKQSNEGGISEQNKPLQAGGIGEQKGGVRLTTLQSGAAGVPKQRRNTATEDEMGMPDTQEDVSYSHHTQTKRSMLETTQSTSAGAPNRKRVKAVGADANGNVGAHSEMTSVGPTVDAVGNGRGEHESSVKIRCKFENCATTAVYGLKGVPRYW